MVGIVSDVGLKRTLNEDFASYLEKEEFKNICSSRWYGWT